ncbi:MAG: OmpA family protein [Kofleriaceae bacterium]
MKRVAASVLALVAAPSLALAEVEVGGLAGLHVFSKEGDLGVPDNAAPEDRESLKNSAIFGLRLGVYFANDSIGVEAEAGVIPTEPRMLVFDVYSLAYRGSLVYQLRAADPTNRILPFVIAGAGQIQIFNSLNKDVVEESGVLAIHAGVGAKYRAANDWGVRLDFRGLLVPKVESGQAFDAEAIVSIYKEFGRKKKTIAPVVEPPKVDDDPDKDGILGANDKCPTEAEDMDGFQDEDGCVDADNDGDGVADGTDKCVAEPEDKDSFQDEDGCPDPDNDGDGVPDAADKCGDQPETRNGFQDDDGCPDEIPETLKKFTGVIQGITFKTGDATLLPASNKILDKAVAVLQEFKDVKLEIQGHTDDVALKPRKGAVYQDNLSLSQGRADAVKSYFQGKGIDESRLIAKGYGDTMPAEPPTGLKGAKLNAARAKNRRVEFKLITSGDAPADPPKTEPTPEPAPAPAPEAPPAEKK